jgi:hypothetical protein
VNKLARRLRQQNLLDFLVSLFKLANFASNCVIQGKSANGLKTISLFHRKGNCVDYLVVKGFQHGGMNKMLMPTADHIFVKGCDVSQTEGLEKSSVKRCLHLYNVSIHCKFLNAGFSI